MGMAIAHTLPQLLVARLVLGAMGAASTLAFLIAGRRGNSLEVRNEVAAVQLAMTTGQVLGPLGGAMAAARLGFRTVVRPGRSHPARLGGVRALGRAGSRRADAPAAAGDAGEVARPGDAGGAGPGRLQPALLPDGGAARRSCPGLGVAPEGVVEVGGLVVFVSAVAAGVGALMTPRLAALLPERRLMAGLLHRLRRA